MERDRIRAVTIWSILRMILFKHSGYNVAAWVFHVKFKTKKKHICIIPSTSLIRLIIFLEYGNHVRYHFQKKMQQDTVVILWNFGVISCTLFYTSEDKKLKYVKHIFTIKIKPVYFTFHSWKNIFNYHCFLGKIVVS